MKWGYYEEMAYRDVSCLINKNEILPKREITNCNAMFARETSDMDLNATDLWAVNFQKHGSWTEFASFFFPFCNLKLYEPILKCDMD